ncbi:ATP-dependent DNA ligase [Sinorhizobium sojae CCBAU 05684]|uniref:DNA ligase (ATP) n=1 Tax=Sinorhizobium sojae CCBAU 05684 TaxID=716928 RepID=A0A249PAC6_9HYPH|nr:ATP-dependent DNA ligase [Sinorhizobium sojae CCBAU 05684]
MPSFIAVACHTPFSSSFSPLTSVYPASSIRSCAWASVKLFAPSTGAVGFCESGVATAGVSPSAEGVVCANDAVATAPISAAAKIIVFFIICLSRKIWVDPALETPRSANSSSGIIEMRVCHGVDCVRLRYRGLWHYRRRYKMGRLPAGRSHRTGKGTDNSRGGYDWTVRFASIAAEAGQLGYERLILDGEAVMLDDQGRSDLGTLQRALGTRPSLHGLSYVGGCGTGCTYLESAKLRELLDQIVTDRPAVSLRRKAAVFTQPLLVAEVEYRAWTDEGKLRHPYSRGSGSGRKMRRAELAAVAGDRTECSPLSTTGKCLTRPVFRPLWGYCCLGMTPLFTSHASKVSGHPSLAHFPRYEKPGPVRPLPLSPSSVR